MSAVPEAPVTKDRGGRPPVTTTHDLAETAQQLFLERGFDEVTVDDIAAAAGISRRTFFRHFSTKTDVLWVETPADNDRLAALLADVDPALPYAEVLTDAAPRALRAEDPAWRDWALHRAQLIFSVPEVQTRAYWAFSGWRELSTAFVARHLSVPADCLFAISVGQAFVAATISAHMYWVAHPEEDLASTLRNAMALHLPNTLS